VNSDNPIVFVVDDDHRVREAVSSLLASVGLQVVAFGSAAEFLESEKPDSPACLVLDLELPDTSGLELQRELAAGDGPPIVFITGHGDIPMTVQAMKAGAIEFLTKPFSPEALLAAICSAVERSRTFLAQQLALKTLRECEKSLSRRERDVMALVIRGQLNKQVGAALGISEITVKAHRGQVMRKMHAKSLADLVMMATRLRQTPEES
jgi:FixJ family two-component response regulator